MSDTKADTQVSEGETPESHPSPTGTGESQTPDPAAADDSTEDEEETPPVTKEDFDRLRRKADRRERELRKAQEELKELRGKGEQEQEDPEARANQKLIRASARAVLAGVGVTDRTVQGEVMGLINLSDIEVDDAGDPDEDEIADRISRLRKALGAEVKPARRTPARDTADRGASQGSDSDPDKARMRAFLRGR
jgi:hypothetical protein